MFKTVKSLELLEVISRKSVTSLSELTVDKSLRSIFQTRSESATKRRIIDTMSLLARQGFVSVGHIDGEKIYKLSVKGRKHLQTYLIVKSGVTRHARWDRSWYIVTFDIPESKKVARNSLITHLKNQNFYNYTKGLWILPYDPRRFITDLSDHLGLKGLVKIIVAHKLDDETKLKRYYRL